MFQQIMSGTNDIFTIIYVACFIYYVMVAFSNPKAHCNNPIVLSLFLMWIITKLLSVF